MPNKAFTIRIYLPDGDPEGVQVIDRMNWTGIGVFFPVFHGSNKRSKGLLSICCQLLHLDRTAISARSVIGVENEARQDQKGERVAMISTSTLVGIPDS
jgi:hypothetical protein